MTFDWSQQIQPRIGITWNPNLLSRRQVLRHVRPVRGPRPEVHGALVRPLPHPSGPGLLQRDDRRLPRLAVSAARPAANTSRPTSSLRTARSSSVGYSAAATKDLTFDVYYQYRNLKNAFEDTPINPADYFGSFQAKNFFNARRTYDALTLDLQKRYANCWYADMNITFSRLYGNWDEDYTTGVFNTSSFLEDEPGWNSADPNRYGHLGQDRPIIFKLMGSYDLPMGFVVGGFLRVQSGTPWEARGGTPSTASGRYLETAGTNRLPTWTTVDLLLAYNLKFGGNMAARIEARVANVFDTQTVLSVNSVKYNDGYVDGNPANNLGLAGTTQPNANFGNATSWASPRRFTVTARLDF